MNISILFIFFLFVSSGLLSNLDEEPHASPSNSTSTRENEGGSTDVRMIALIVAPTAGALLIIAIIAGILLWRKRAAGGRTKTESGVENQSSGLLNSANLAGQTSEKSVRFEAEALVKFCEVEVHQIPLEKVNSTAEINSEPKLENPEPTSLPTPEIAPEVKFVSRKEKNKGLGFNIPVEELNLIAFGTNSDSVERGSFGELGLRSYNGKQVAYKKIYLKSKMPKDQLIQEAMEMEKLEHENIAKLFGVVCNDPKAIGIVMQFYGKGSLYAKLHEEKRVYSTSEIKSLALGLINGMEYLHAEGIIHRNLKSSNVLLKEKSVPVIGDYGMARYMDLTDQRDNVGSLLYTAPEIMRGEQYDGKCDVYGFGLILWELINNSIPFCDISPFELVQSVGIEGYRSPLLLKPNSEASIEIKVLLQVCWSQNPTRRPSFSELKKTFFEFQD